MQYYEIKIECKAGYTEDAENFLVINDITDYFVTDPQMDATILNEMNWLIKDEDDIINAYITICETEKDKANEIYNLIKSQYDKTTIREACDSEWKDNWKQFARVTHISDTLVIQPAWVNYEKKENERVILLDSGAAFGTGTHETTQMCAELLNKYIKSGLKTMLDIGTGSGILAIIAGVLGGEKILATDIDKVACETAKINIKANNIQDICTVRNGNLLECVESNNEKFDIITANIIADVLLILFDDIKKVLKDDGIVIMSGILEERCQEIVDKGKNKGFKLTEKTSLNDWCALVFERE